MLVEIDINRPVAEVMFQITMINPNVVIFHYDLY